MKRQPLRTKRTDTLFPYTTLCRSFLLNDPVVIDDDSWTKAMVKGKAAPEMLDAAIAALDELTAWEAAGIRLAVEAAAVAVGLVNAEGQPQLSKAQEIGRASCRERVCQYV